MATDPDIELSDALAIALEAVGAAVDLLRGASAAVGAIRTKSNARDLVTEWDTRSEDCVRERLQALTPGIAILGEERGGSDGDCAQRWLLDPIDGTVNFAHGLPFFAVSLALERDGEPVIGVVAAPDLGWQFRARRGGGAFMNDVAMRVSGVTSLANSMLASGFPYDRATNTNNNFRQWEHFQRTAGACRRLGAASLDLCMVARGWIDGYWEARLNPWDIAAGALIVGEAGGTVTSIDGDAFASASGNAVASNGAIHKELLAELAALEADARKRDLPSYR